MSLLLGLVCGGFFLGVFQGLSPDRWLKLSYVAWKKVWSGRQIIKVFTLAHAFHVLGALILATVLLKGSSNDYPELLGPIASLFALFSFGYRLQSFLKFQAIQKAARSAPILSGLFFTHLGLSEALLLVLIKAPQVHWTALCIAYGLGHSLAYAVCFFTSLKVYDNPIKHVSWLNFWNQPRRLVPAAVVVALLVMASMAASYSFAKF